MVLWSRTQGLSAKCGREFFLLTVPLPLHFSYIPAAQRAAHPGAASLGIPKPPAPESASAFSQDLCARSSLRNTDLDAPMWLIQEPDMLEKGEGKVNKLPTED